MKALSTTANPSRVAPVLLARSASSLGASVQWSASSSRVHCRFIGVHPPSAQLGAQGSQAGTAAAVKLGLGRSWEVPTIGGVGTLTNGRRWQAGAIQLRALAYAVEVPMPLDFSVPRVVVHFGGRRQLLQPGVLQLAKGPAADVY
jgi:hypothetical protein